MSSGARIITSVSREDVEAIYRSGLFDEKWYLNRYPDVKTLGMDPAEHYLWIGARLNRDPSPKFQTAAYILKNPDIKLNPILHYMRSVRLDPFGVAIDLPARAITAKASRAKLTIAYDSHNLKLQGAPNSLFEIASGVKRRQKYDAVLMANEMGPLADNYRQKGIECVAHHVSPNRLKRVDEREKYIRNLADFYKSAGAALVHVNTLQNFHCILAAYHARVPSVWNIRESEDPETYYDYLPPDLRELAYSCFAKANAIIFVAEATRKRWRPRLDGVVENFTILNGVDISRLMRYIYGTSRAMLRSALGLGENDVLILSVGTVAPRKGQQDLIDAMNRLNHRTRQKIVLAIAGFNGSEYSHHVQKELQPLEKRGLRVISVEESASDSDRQRIAELYCASDVFVLTSRIESYPRVTLEAMEFGLPIISTPCFGVQEQLVDGVSALFYEEGNIEKLSGHIRFLCNAPDERQKLAVAAKERLTRLNSYEQMLDAYEATYARVLNGRSVNSS